MSYREQHYVRTLLARRVDGIIVTGRRSDLRAPISRDLPVPVVYAMSESSDPNDASILPDDEGGGLLAVQHLIATGRALVGHITGPEHFRAARLRAAGAERASRRRDFPLPAASLSTVNGARLGVAGPPACCCAPRPPRMQSSAGATRSRGVSEALRDMGSSVPDDVALVGFDNWSVMAEASQPPLTTVDMNLPEVGRVAAETLLAAIAGRAVHGVQVVPSRLVVRASTLA